MCSLQYIFYIISSNSENWRIDLDIKLQIRLLARLPEDFRRTSKFNSSFMDGILVYRQSSQNVFCVFRSLYIHYT
jgi:hypothetical protein